MLCVCVCVRVCVCVCQGHVCLTSNLYQFVFIINSSSNDKNTCYVALHILYLLPYFDHTHYIPISIAYRQVIGEDIFS